MGFRQTCDAIEGPNLPLFDQLLNRQAFALPNPLTQPPHRAAFHDQACLGRGLRCLKRDKRIGWQRVDCPARGRTAPGRNMEICKYESLVTFMDGNQRLVTFVSSDIYNEIRPLGRTKDNVVGVFGRLQWHAIQRHDGAA